MTRNRLFSVVAVAAILVVGAAVGATALAQQGGDPDDGAEPKVIRIERDGDILRIEVDLAALDIDVSALDQGELTLEDLELPLLRALLARLGVAPEDLDFEAGGLEALRDLFGDPDSDPAELLRRFLEDRDLPELDRLRERFGEDGELRFRDDHDGHGGFTFDFGGGPLLGVTLDDSFTVTYILPGSAAEHAGVAVGDVIRSVEGHAVADIEELREAIAAVEPGVTYELGIARGDAALTLEVVRPEPSAGATLEGLGGDELRRFLEGLRDGSVIPEDVPPNLRFFFEHRSPLRESPPATELQSS